MLPYVATIKRGRRARWPTPEKPSSFPDTPPGWRRRMNTVETLTVAQQARAQQGQHAPSDPVTFSNEIRRLMAERRMGLRELARQVHYDPGYLSKIVNGRKAVSGDLARRLDAALDAGGVLAAFRTNPDLRGAFAYDEERLIRAARSPKRLDRAVIRSLAEALAAEHRLVDQLDPVQILEAVDTQLSVVRNLAREARAPLRGEV